MAAPNKIEKLAMELSEGFASARTPQGKREALAEISRVLDLPEHFNSAKGRELRENLAYFLKDQITDRPIDGVINFGMAAVKQDVRQLVADMRRSLLTAHPSR
jgi:hypothetical protein